MEIIFELENSDIEIEFTPDFDWVHQTQPGRNKSDFTKVQWKLQDRGGTAIVADVLLELPDETTYIIPNHEADDV